MQSKNVYSFSYLKSVKEIKELSYKYEANNKDFDTALYSAVNKSHDDGFTGEDFVTAVIIELTNILENLIADSKLKPKAKGFFITIVRAIATLFKNKGK
jgi:hypothetical protein